MGHRTWTSDLSKRKFKMLFRHMKVLLNSSRKQVKADWNNNGTERKVCLPLILALAPTVCKTEGNTPSHMLPWECELLQPWKPHHATNISIASATHHCTRWTAMNKIDKNPWTPGIYLLTKSYVLISNNTFEIAHILPLANHILGESILQKSSAGM